MAARGLEGLGYHHALVRVDEAVRQPVGDPLEAERGGEDEDGQQEGAGDAVAPPQARRAALHPPSAEGLVAAPPLASSRKQLTAPV